MKKEKHLLIFVIIIYILQKGLDLLIKPFSIPGKILLVQLLISCTMGTPNDKEKVQKICDEIGAEIVGYIELTSDFQIEFKRDMSYDELMKIANELTEKYYFIESVALNYAVPYGPDDNGLD